MVRTIYKSRSETDALPTHRSHCFLLAMLAACRAFDGCHPALCLARISYARSGNLAAMPALVLYDCRHDRYSFAIRLLFVSFASQVSRFISFIIAGFVDSAL